MKSHHSSQQLADHQNLQMNVQRGKHPKTLQQYQANSRGSRPCSGLAMSSVQNSELRYKESVPKLQLNEESMHLRRSRHQNLPPSAVMNSNSTTNSLSKLKTCNDFQSSNALLNTQSAIQSYSTASLPLQQQQKVKQKAKKIMHKRNSIQSNASYGALQCQPQTSRSSRQLQGRSSNINFYAKENQQNNFNVMPNKHDMSLRKIIDAENEWKESQRPKRAKNSERALASAHQGHQKVRDTNSIIPSVCSNQQLQKSTAMGLPTYRSEQFPAAPQSSHPKPAQFPKPQQSAKRQKKQTKRDKVVSQERKLHALQLQFMQQTLNRLQKEKLSRAEALNRAILRKKCNSQMKGHRSDSAFSLTSASQMTDKRSAAVPSEGRKSRLQESFLSQSSRFSQSRSRNNSQDSYLKARSTGGSVLRQKPRLCELSKLHEDSTMNYADLVPLKSTRPEGPGPIHNTRKSHQQYSPSSKKQHRISKMKKQSSRSSSGCGQKPQKNTKKSQKKMPYGDNSSWKCLPANVCDDQLKRRQEKIRRMEEQLIQSQIERTPTVQIKDISVAQSQNTTLPHPNMFNYVANSSVSANIEYSAASVEHNGIDHHLIGRIETNGYGQPDIFAIPDKLTYRTGPSDEHFETDAGDGQCEVYVLSDNADEPELQSEDTFAHRTSYNGQKVATDDVNCCIDPTNHHQVYYSYQPTLQNSQQNLPLQMNNIFTSSNDTKQGTNQQQSNHSAQQSDRNHNNAPQQQHHNQQQHNNHQQQQLQQQTTDEKLTAMSSQNTSSQAVLSQVTIPQIGSIHNMGCFEVSQSVNDVSIQNQQPPQALAMSSQRITEQQTASHTVLVSNAYSLDTAGNQIQSTKKCSTNKDQRRSDETPHTMKHNSKHEEIDLPRQMESRVTDTEESVLQRNKLINFFEQEYRTTQKELITSKSDLYEQKYKTELLKKRCNDYEQLVSRMNNDIIKLQAENTQLKHDLLETQCHVKSWRTTPTAQQDRQNVPQLSQISEGLYNKDMTTHRTNSCLQSEHKNESISNHDNISQEVLKIREENQQLQQQNSQLVQQLMSLQSSQKSQEVLIQYLQGTQNSILQKMQHQMIKNLFTQNLVETAQLATNFMSGDKEQSDQILSATEIGSNSKSTKTMTQQQYHSTPTGFIPSSLDLQQFIQLKKEDIGSSVDEYFRRTNEAAGLSSEKQDGDEGDQTSQVISNSLIHRVNSTALEEAPDKSHNQDGSDTLAANNSSQVFVDQQKNCYFGSGLILPEDCQDFSKVISQAGEPQTETEVNSNSRGIVLSLQESSCHHVVEESSMVNDYDSKNFSEHRQKQLKQRLSGISPVTNIRRRADSRRSLSYQKSDSNGNQNQQNQHQQSSIKAVGAPCLTTVNTNNDVSLISLSHVNSNSKYMVPKQMRQLLRKHSSEDGEIEDYLQTGAFEKRSNEMRLFSLDGTAQQDIQNMIELSQTNTAEELGEVHKVLSSPVKDFIDNANESQSHMMLNLNQLQNMQEPLSKVNQIQLSYPDALNQMRHKLVFSDNLHHDRLQEESAERVEEDQDDVDVEEVESQLSSPEMDCTQTDSKITTNNNASMKTKEQREISAILAATKQQQQQQVPQQLQQQKILLGNNLQVLQYVDQITKAANNLQLSDCEFPKAITADRHQMNIIKSPQFNNNCQQQQVEEAAAATLNLKDAEVSGTSFIPDGNASQEMYYSKTQNSMNIHTATVAALPHSTCKVSSTEMMITKQMHGVNETNEASDERSNTTVSASFLHNIQRSHMMGMGSGAHGGGGHHRKNNPSMTSHDTVPVDYFLQRENTQGSSCNMSGMAQHPMTTGTLTHMPTEQCMPRLTSSFQHQLKASDAHHGHHHHPHMQRTNMGNSVTVGVNTSQASVANLSGSYSPFKTHQPGQIHGSVSGGVVVGSYNKLQASSSRRPLHQSQSRSTSPNPTCNGSVQHEYCSQSANTNVKDLASSSERIQKRTKKMKAEISEIDRDIAMLHNVISR